MTVAPLATLALEEFRRRQTKARVIVAARRMPLAEAEAHLRPWAAIATHCGADLPEAAELRADIMAEAEPAGWNPGAVRWLIAEELCPRARWAPVLTAARDLAFDRLHPAVAERSEAEPRNAHESAEAVATAAALHRIAMALAHDVNGQHPIPGYDAARRIERARKAEPERKAA
ncbi:MAG: hypothetical protein EBR82_29425 [Caulobacteraceae bacterium]|nr:hypothetical protein [Caulobacteraceae bacterium]